MKLSVVILNYNVRYFLELCIKSVIAATADLDAEIIVVDNNSADTSCQMIAQLFPEVVLIKNKQNLGFSKGTNIGVAQAKGDYLCILNPDTVVAEDTFKKCLAYAEKILRMGVLGCQLIDGRGQFLPESKRNIPTPSVSIKKILGFSKSYYANHLKPSDIGKVDILVGAFMFLKKDVFKHVNGFDEDYFMYGEDIDFSYKVLKLGYQNIYYGDTTILHYKGESTLKDKTYAKRFYGAMQIFYDKHFKSHPAFDTIVWLGIKFGSFILERPKPINIQIEAYILLSKNLSFNLKLPFQYELKRDLKTVAAHSQIIFDGSTINYKRIIGNMATSDAKKSLTFRILPNNAQFIIGSDSSQERGEVVLLLNSE